MEADLHSVGGPMYQKLTPTQVDEIRRRYAAGCSAKRLAIEYKVVYSTIYNLVHSRSWSPSTMLNPREWNGI